MAWKEISEQLKQAESVELTSDDEGSQNKDAETEVQNPKSINEINNTDAVDVTAPHDTEIRNEDNTIIHNKSTQPKSQHSQAKNAKGIKSAKNLPLSASAVLMSRLLDQQGSIPQQREHDELDRLFLNISETVKKFSPYLQAIVKHKIFSLVSEMELQQLAPPRFITTSSQYGNTLHLQHRLLHTFKRETHTPMPTSPETWDTSMTNDWNQSGNVLE
ncbi:unnamed protein product [Parnassius apollo]|uniref:(apollo) hypothetical protein n=1 Tax=Parnassius apollo TaxID=110799 RepID=A0A8S3WNB3_PARAO|nr:unnamed protein product [Parnassius apollo]